MAGLSTTTSASESGSLGVSAAPQARRGSSHSLSELARNNFYFDALVITKRPDDHGRYISHDTKLQAMVDTGSDVNIVSTRALSKTGIDDSRIEDVDTPQDLEGLEGSEGLKFGLTKRVRLTWGKAKHNGQQTRHGYFYVVKELPENLEMILGRKHLHAEIEKHVSNQRRRSRARLDMQNREEEDEELDDWVVFNTNRPRC